MTHHIVLISSSATLIFEEFWSLSLTLLRHYAAVAADVILGSEDGTKTSNARSYKAE